MALDNFEIELLGKTLDDYISAYEQKDLKLIETLLSPAVQGFGTGPDEVIRNREETLRQFKRDFDQCEGVKIRMTDIQIRGQLPVAWMMAFCTFIVTIENQEFELAGRYTAVFRKENDRWLFEQIHYSLPAAEQEESQSYPRQL
jgi:ketosteroid isomerase-like protein